MKDAYHSVLLLHSLCSIIVFPQKFLILGTLIFLGELKSLFFSHPCHVVFGINNPPNKSFILKSNLAKHILLEPPNFLLLWIWQRDYRDSAVGKARPWFAWNTMLQKGGEHWRKTPDVKLWLLHQYANVDIYPFQHWNKTETQVIWLATPKGTNSKLIEFIWYWHSRWVESKWYENSGFLHLNFRGLRSLSRHLEWKKPCRSFLNSSLMRSFI